MKFSLSSHECEILLAFEQSSSLENLSRLIRKDPSVLSRNLNAIAQKAPVLEKLNGRWVLTENGKKLNRWTEEAISTQSKMFKEQTHLRIATTREFASLVLIPHLKSLTESTATMSLLTSDHGIENLLLEGRADFGIECGQPVDPSIGHKKVSREEIAAVISPLLAKKFQFNISAHSSMEMGKIPFLRQIRNLGAEHISSSENIFANFSDYASLRTACVQGYGWAILPIYQIQKELKSKQLMIIPSIQIPPQYFGVWWPRQRKSIQPWVQKTIQWLNQPKIKNLLLMTHD